MARTGQFRSHERVFELSALEGRVLLSAAGDAVRPLSALPLLNSYAAATAQLYLDFDGDLATRWDDYSVPATPAYDQDGDATTFSEDELDSIREIWARVAEKYSPFNINVTTVNPGSLQDRRVMRVVIGGDGAWAGDRCGGLSYVGSFHNVQPNTAYVFSENLAWGTPLYVAEAAAHEAGHGFGLEHQSRYDSRGRLIEEYRAGNGEVAPLMGNSYDAVRGLWWKGTTVSPDAVQDDMAVLASSANGFGYRPDDHGNSISAAEPLRVAGERVRGAGVIERTTDADWFSFFTGAGEISLSIDVAAFGPMLDMTARLVSSDGSIVASADTYRLGETLTATLAEGTYYLAVMSNGVYGDVGQYSISGTLVPVQIAAPAAPSGLAAAAQPGGQVWLTWNRPAGDVSAYIIERSEDQDVWTELATVSATAAGYVDRGLTPGTTCHYRVRAIGAGGISDPSATASATVLGNTAPATPGRVRVGYVAKHRLKLTWADNSDDELGFRIQWSIDGVKWRTLGRTAPGRTSVLITTRRPGLYFRVSAFNQNGESRFSQKVSPLSWAATQRRAAKKAEPVFSVRPVNPLLRRA